MIWDPGRFGGSSNNGRYAAIWFYRPSPRPPSLKRKIFSRLLWCYLFFMVPRIISIEIHCIWYITEGSILGRRASPKGVARSPAWLDNSGRYCKYCWLPFAALSSIMKAWRRSSPVYASRATSRLPAHDSGPRWSSFSFRVGLFHTLLYGWKNIWTSGVKRNLFGLCS
jgi:hypothetical protein